LLATGFVRGSVLQRLKRARATCIDRVDSRAKKLQKHSQALCTSISNHRLGASEV
jgi:hypothetical protein